MNLTKQRLVDKIDVFDNYQDEGYERELFDLAKWAVEIEDEAKAIRIYNVMRKMTVFKMRTNQKIETLHEKILELTRLYIVSKE